jgi:hypothetical protein
MPSRPGEFHPEPLTDSGRDTLASSGFAPLRPIGTFGLAVGAACAFSLGIAGQVPTFRTRARLSFAPPTYWMPLGQSQCIPQSLSRKMGQPPVLTLTNRISTLPKRFACARLSQSYLTESCSGFSATFTTLAFDPTSGSSWRCGTAREYGNPGARRRSLTMPHSLNVAYPDSSC